MRAISQPYGSPAACRELGVSVHMPTVEERIARYIGYAQAERHKRSCRQRPFGPMSQAMDRSTMGRCCR